MTSLDSATKSKVFCLDAHIEPLLALPVTVSLPSLQPYTDSRLIAQDKASCMPAWILLSSLLAAEDLEVEKDLAAPVKESMEGKMERRKKNGVKIIDSTAAPGNKTTMAAALADNGMVIAVERDVGRYKVLKEMCAKAGAKSAFADLVQDSRWSTDNFLFVTPDVTAMNVDFLSIDPQDPKFKNVSHFLVDPSCCESPAFSTHLLPLIMNDLLHLRQSSRFRYSKSTRSFTTRST